MACCPTEKSYGYDGCRFEKDVDEHLYCSICYNVLKEPRACRNNDHIFCLACITEHLTVNSQTCPECNEHLSVDTLRWPRVVNKILLNLKIKCDYASRGCPEFVRVEELQTHAENCGFAPVLCSSEECGLEINKKDKVHHETDVCEYRKVKCRDLKKIQEAVGILEGSLTELDEQVINNHDEMKKVVGKFEESLVGINERINEKVEAMKNSHDELKRDQQAVKKELEEVTKQVKDAKENISKASRNLDEVKNMITQILEKLNMLELLNKLPSPTEGMINTPREDILIAGGKGDWNARQSTEIYSWKRNDWFEASELNAERVKSSSFFYKDQLFVLGGIKNKTIETLDLNDLPLKWMNFPEELPYKFAGHQTVVHQQRIIHIGGFNYDEHKTSNVISELELSSPCNMKELCQMPEPRQKHGAEIFEDKVYIMGGLKNHDDINDDGNGDDDNSGDDSSDDDGSDDSDAEIDLVALKSVLEFDINQNECKEIAPLPHALAGMATVRWKDQIVVLGGKNEKREILNDVFMYDCKTGKITTLPPMLERRYLCCAVITENTIVVMGGEDEDSDALDSVECFTMGGLYWEHLPEMDESRRAAFAEVV